ncbi:D-amino-acid transaminase [Agrobacterium tumefaciens]|uniref:D-amino-acid transaminase n=1 Tax=Agrobacterium tumefaciens TaxID=358 RepID=UPI001572A3AE|nr:D-amino-acid transaminase [Agrobacterium tumefaciens]NTE66243.1 D-amino-acid transaminase [Agrobacterium tumefaciens]
MSKKIYLNGNFVSEDQATVSVFDRSFLFGDGIYEVVAVVEGKLIDPNQHISRLFRSADAIGLKLPGNADNFKRIFDRVIEQDKLDEGALYLQVSRGNADRDFTYADTIQPNVVAFGQRKALTSGERLRAGIRTVTLEDIRWRRRDIKSTSLLAQVLPKQKAKHAGCGEAILYEDKMVTEGASTTVFIVTSDGQLVTRPLSNDVLPSITRRAAIAVAHDLGITVAERIFSLKELKSAREVFLVGSTFFVVPVVDIDGGKVADGIPGGITLRIQNEYIRLAKLGAPMADRTE